MSAASAALATIFSVVYHVINGRRVREGAPGKTCDYPDAFVEFEKGGATYSRCTIGDCTTELKISTSSGLIKRGPITEHMKTKHYGDLTAAHKSSVDKENAEKAAKGGKKRRVDDDDDVEVVGVVDTKMKKKMTDSLVELISYAPLPFMFVQNKAFEYFCSTWGIATEWIASRTTVTRAFDATYESVFVPRCTAFVKASTCVVDIVSGGVKFPMRRVISVMTDGWKNKQTGDSFLSIALQAMSVVDNSLGLSTSTPIRWVPHALVTGFCYFAPTRATSVAYEASLGGHLTSIGLTWADIFLACTDTTNVMPAIFDLAQTAHVIWMGCRQVCTLCDV